MRVLSHFPAEPLRAALADFPDVEVVPVPGDGDPPEDARGEILLTWAWGAPNLPRVVERGVRWIHTVGTGIDRFPLAAVGDRMLTCARGATAVPIAEWVLATMLAFEKRLPDAWIHEPPETWNRGDLGTLEGRCLGLVGLGTIGTAVARRAAAFDMRIAAVRRSDRPSPDPQVELLPDLDTLAARADHLVVVAAATPETRHLVGAGVLRAVTPGVHLVNVARGSLVDQQALREALDDGRVAQASLDVCEPEPLPAGHWLYTHPRVRLSPHCSWAAPGAVERILETFVDNLHRHRRGEPLMGRVDLERGY